MIQALTRGLPFFGSSSRVAQPVTGGEQQPRQRALVAPLAALMLMASSLAPALAQNGFDAWMEAAKQEGERKGISSATLNAAFQGVRPDPKIIKLDRSQPEFRQTFGEYLDKRVTATRINKGREMLAKHRLLLERIGARYGVQPRFIVALWGLETNYGSYTGGKYVIEALATLAYDGRRSDYFRKEMFNALRILDEGHITIPNMKGSWAGAMGQCQFMPSSFLTYAVDYTGDGHKDIWTTQGDVFASIANYLKGTGWRDDRTWGRRVQLPRDFDMGLEGRKVKRTLAQWQALGVRRANGADLPQVAGMEGSVIAPDGINGRAYLVYGNFNRIMRWNNSTYFATSVGLLSDRIAGR